MGKRFWVVPCVIVVAVLVSLQAQEIQRKPDDLIRDLASKDFRTREKASEALWKLGIEAEPALRKAAGSSDPEMAERVKNILDRFDAGIYPDTPPEVQEQLRLFLNQDEAKKLAAVRKLVSFGPTALPSLRAALKRNMGSETRLRLFHEIAMFLRNEASKAFLNGRDDLALDLLALNALGPSNAGISDYVIELQRQNKCDAAVEQLTLLQGDTELKECLARTLVFLRRAQGKHDDAIREALQIEEKDRAFQPVTDRLLEDANAWDRLATRPVADANSLEGLKAFRLRRAGKLAEAKSLLDAQIKSDFRNVQRNGALDPATLALLLNDRTTDGLARIAEQKNAPQILADILTVKFKFKEALDVLPDADDEDGISSFAAPLYAVRRARLMHLTGKRDEATKLFDEVAAITPGPDGYRVDLLTQLIRAEVRCGRHEQAARHFGTLSKSISENRVFGQDGYEVVFEAQADAARTLFQVFREQGTTDTGEAMHFIWQALKGKGDPHRLALLKKKLTEVQRPSIELVQAHAALLYAEGKKAEAAQLMGEASNRLLLNKDGTLAERVETQRSRMWVFGTDESFRFFVTLADLWHELGEHAKAIKSLETGLRAYPGQPVLLYLLARSQQQLGNTTEATRLRALAHRAPLGNANVRGRFLEELINRGDYAEAKIEVEQILRCAWLAELFIGNVWNQVGRLAVLTQDFDLAQMAYGKTIHYLLRTPGVSYVEGSGYFNVPKNIKHYQIRSLFNRGQVDEALAKARELMAEAPGTTELVIALVPKLEAQSRQAEAQALFKSSWEALHTLCDDYPEACLPQATAAWLAAGCQRELAAAEKLARGAYEREPHIPFHAEALAEVYFRQGKRDEAMQLMKKLIQDDPRNFFYQRQLTRYRTEAFTAPLPEMDD